MFNILGYLLLIKANNHFFFKAVNMTIEQLLEAYTYPLTWDEMMADRSVRPHYKSLMETLAQLDTEKIRQKHQQASELFMNVIN
jgi:hypothetical protein